MSNGTEKQQFITFPLEDLIIGEELPGTIYLYIDFRFITFRASGDIVDRATYERLEVKKVRNLFIHDVDRDKFIAWVRAKQVETNVSGLPEQPTFAAAREDAHRTALDIFRPTHPERVVSQGVQASKKLVSEVMKFPYAVRSIGQIHAYSRGTVDHSVNVSILSIYLAMQMGYTHEIILQHVGLGSLLHDIGKTQIHLNDQDTPDEIEAKMREHPNVGFKILDTDPRVPNEVKLIVAQHHEAADGTGYPKRLKGNGIYDLARIVIIANAFDELVADGKGPLPDRQRHAVQQMDQVIYKRFDAQKLEKALKILKVGI